MTRMLALLAGLALAPAVILGLHADYLLFPATRIVVFAIAAVALDLILGFGGMVSFGQAAVMGVGAYTLAIAGVNGLTDLAVTLPLAAVTGAVFAGLTGAIALRTGGVYFIMITLAFGQMAFFTASSLAQYGGDDGLTLGGASTLFGTAIPAHPVGLFYLCLAVLAVMLLGLGRVVRSRFGRVLRGTRDAPDRMRALGYGPFPYRLLAYAASGAITAVAGALLAELTQFAAPAYMAWPVSGDLLVMVILGGAGTLWGPVLGAVAYLALSDWLGAWTDHWRVIVGPLLVLAVLARAGAFRRFAPRLTPKLTQ
jgi:branched-chain amino acid transport system permease protein